MMQELFRIPYLNFPIYGYGVMLVIGFFLAMELSKYLARRFGIDPDIFANAALIALVAGVAGARLSHVIENIHDYTNPSRSAWKNFVDAINIREGGLTYYGGFLLAFPTVVAYGIWKKVPIRLGMDIIAPCLMIGLGLGRVGCFLNGCCYGAECNLPWAVRFPYHSNAFMEEYQQHTLKVTVPDAVLSPPDVWGERWPLPVSQVGPQPQLTSNALHPAQLYSTFTGLLLAAFCLAYLTIPHAPGQVFAAMMTTEGICRFLLEIFRDEPVIRHVGHYGFSLGMLQGLGLAAVGVVMSSGVWSVREEIPGRYPGGGRGAEARNGERGKLTGKCESCGVG